MTTATFRVAVRGTTTLIHDPATGLTHRNNGETHRDDGELPSGRVILAPEQVAALPTVGPSECQGRVPISVCWSPVVRCNLNCPHCLDDKATDEGGPADRSRIAWLIGAAGVLGVDISGGEPLLLGDLPALADALVRRGCVVSVTTNGWHLRRRAEALASHIDAVRVSLDGPTAEAHDAWRGEGSFSRALDGIRAARAVGLRVQVQTVLMASTCRDAQGMLDLAAEHGAGGVTFLQMLPIGEGARLGHQELISDDAAVELVDGLAIPDRLSVQLRTRRDAGGFTVIRADGRVWRNGHPADWISARHPLRTAADLALTGPDGSA